MKLFTVVPQRYEDIKKARILESIINRPDFTSKIMSAMEDYVNKFLLPEVMMGTPINPIDVERFFADITKHD